MLKKKERMLVFSLPSSALFGLILGAGPEYLHPRLKTMLIFTSSSAALKVIYLSKSLQTKKYQESVILYQIKLSVLFNSAKLLQFFDIHTQCLC